MRSLITSSRQRRYDFGIAAAAIVAVSLASCSSSPSRVNQPRISPSSAGQLAMDEYDTNKDGVVSGDELEKAPGLKAALPRLDANGDQGVSADEVAARVQAWQKMRVGLMSFGFTATLDGSPLKDATVTFVPESFLGTDIKSASCAIETPGSGSATIAKEDRPSPKSPPGMQLGLYKVKISKLVGGKEAIPAKYNEATILGQECAPDVSEILNRRVIYTLTTK